MATSELQKIVTRMRISSAVRALTDNLKSVNLGNVKNIRYSFNPFYGNVESIRTVMYELSNPKRRVSNPTCSIKAEVRSDRSEPEMTVLFGDGHKVLFKTNNLTSVEIVAEFNKLCKLHEISTVSSKK